MANNVVTIMVIRHAKASRTYTHAYIVRVEDPVIVLAAAHQRRIHSCMHAETHTYVFVYMHVHA
jgi:hypothetical protein